MALFTMSSHLLNSWNVFVPLLFSFTRKTAAPRRLFGRAKGVIRRERVSSRAVRLICVFSGRADASEAIDSMRDDFEMCWINTPSNTAQMIRMCFDGNVSINKECMCNSVAASGSALEMKLRILRNLVYTACPEPARNAFVRHVRVYLDLAKKASEKFAVYRESIRIGLHSLFSLKLDRLCMATSGVTSHVAFSF